MRHESKLILTHKGHAFGLASKSRMLERGPEVYRAMTHDNRRSAASTGTRISRGVHRIAVVAHGSGCDRGFGHCPMRLSVGEARAGPATGLAEPRLAFALFRDAEGVGGRVISDFSLCFLGGTRFSVPRKGNPQDEC